MNLSSHLARLALGLALLCFNVTSLLAGVSFQQMDLATARTQAQAEDKLFFLYFSADWCMPCQWMENETFQDERLSEYVTDHYLAVKVRLGTGDSKVLQEQFEVTTLPTVLVFSANGQLVDREEGSITATRLLRWLRRLNRPSHHVSRSLPAEEVAPLPALASPQPDIEFSRPALVPVSEEPLLAQGRVYPSEQPTYAYATVPGQFQARSGQSYTIRLYEEAPDYAAAVRRTRELEGKFKEQVELQSNEHGGYQFLVGRFTEQQAAQQLLNYLQRSNLAGQIETH